jgi:hypothetical protein
MEELEETLKQIMTDKELFKVFVCPELTERMEMNN